MANYQGIIVDRTLDRLISKRLIDQTNTERELRTPSGKLSASMLAWPLQWQILKIVGIGTKPFDEYTLRKFERGNHVEKWLIDNMEGVVATQKFLTYQGAIGYADAIVNTKGYEHNFGIMPHEVKSVSNAKFKRILSQGKPDTGHILQACFYALAENSKYFAIDYVSTDDYRIETYILNTKGYEKAVTDAISAFNDALIAYTEHGTIPEFVAKEKWQEKIDYCNYPTFKDLTAEEAKTLAEKMLKKKEVS